MRRAALRCALAALCAQRGAADCRRCCVAPGSAEARKVGAVTCDACEQAAFQGGCLLDKAGALCGVVPALRACVRMADAKAAQACAYQNKGAGLPTILMGDEGAPDDGDAGIVGDYQMCCSWGSTNSTEATCTAVQSSTVAKAQALHDKYWACVSPGTKTTPVGNWTPACNALPDDVGELVQLTLRAHDTFVAGCDGYAAQAAGAACEGSGDDAQLTPADVQEMWDDWQSMAFGSAELGARRRTESCKAKKFAPGCGGPAPPA